MTDGELLEHFLRQDDQTAFAGLVRLHGGMVFGVCRRILGNHHDAEEAFQATFLVLARKASSLKGRASLAGWLHEAAQRTAQNAKRLRARRQTREQQVESMPEMTAQATKESLEMMPYVDEEVSRLPERYRLAIVLCDLEGNSQPEAARKVGCPLGTLSGWLTRGREMLRKRLIRRGLSVSSGVLAMTLSQQAASASVPASLVASTVQMANVWTISSVATAGAISPHVAALTEGVLKTMFYVQIKQMALAAALMVCAGLGAGGIVYQMQAAEPGDGKAKDVLTKLEGTWKIISVEIQGKVQQAADAPVPREALMTFSGDKVTISEKLQAGNTVTAEGVLKINTAKQPYEIDITDIKEVVTKQRGMPDMMGIFEFSGDSLKIRYVEHTDGKDNNGQRVFRPTNLTNTNATDHPHDGLRTLMRVKP